MPKPNFLKYLIQLFSAYQEHLLVWYWNETSVSFKIQNFKNRLPLLVFRMTEPSCRSSSVQRVRVIGSVCPLFKKKIRECPSWTCRQICYRYIKHGLKGGQWVFVRSTVYRSIFFYRLFWGSHPRTYFISFYLAVIRKNILEQRWCGFYPDVVRFIYSAISGSKKFNV